MPALQAHGLPLPVPGARPLLTPEIKRYIADLRSDTVTELASELMCEITGEQQEFVHLTPGFRLEIGQPVGLGLATKMGKRVSGIDSAKGGLPVQGQGRKAAGLALIQPGNG